MSTVEAPDIEVRRPTGYANYNADVTADIARQIEEGHRAGPNYMGEFMWPVSAAYDEHTGVTRVGFSLMAPPEQLRVATCRSCGCTDVKACSPPCSWVEPDLCSACTSTPGRGWSL